jgi:hypothetical protein
MRKTLFVYNYQGLTYRIFETEVQLRNFFEKNFEPNIYFEDENQLENYLIDLKLD